MLSSTPQSHFQESYKLINFHEKFISQYFVSILKLLWNCMLSVWCDKRKAKKKVTVAQTCAAGHQHPASVVSVEQKKKWQFHKSLHSNAISETERGQCFVFARTVGHNCLVTIYFSARDVARQRAQFGRVKYSWNSIFRSMRKHGWNKPTKKKGESNNDK